MLFPQFFSYGNSKTSKALKTARSFEFLQIATPTSKKTKMASKMICGGDPDPWDTPWKSNQDEDPDPDGPWTWRKLEKTIFTTKNNTFDFLFSFLLLSPQMACKVCKAEMRLITNLYVEDGKQWLCQRRIDGKRHRQVTSLRENSIFSGMKIGFTTFLTLAYFWSKDYPANMAEYEINASKPTVIQWYRIFREIVTNAIQMNPVMMGGENKVVEVDESKFGKRKFHRGRMVEGQWVFGMIERGNPKNVVMISVDKRDEATLLPIIQKYIRPGTTIMSDCWKSYSRLADVGYQHLTVNHSKNFVDPETGAHTNTIEASWNVAKRSLPKFGTSKEGLATHLGSFLWRRKYQEDDKFVQLLREISLVYRMTNI